MSRINVLLLFFSLILVSCSDEKNECVETPDTGAITVSVEIDQYQDSLVGVNSKQELVDLFTRQPLLRDYIFRRSEYPDDSVFIREVYSRLTHPAMDTLLMETKRVFGDLTGLKSEFEEAFKNMTYYYPGMKVPKIQTVVSGLDTDLLVTDSLIIIGLDFYLGKDGRFRPKMYDYLLRKYDSNDIIPSIMLLYGIHGMYNKTAPTDKTVLADMIAYGKSFYFAKHMLPCTPDSVLISYTPEEIKGSRKNQDLIWARFIESEVLYSTSHVVKKDYLGERPITVQVGEKCPGRIGQWVGWQIVSRYMETHPEMTLPQLMEFEDAQKFFKDSRYKPGRR